MRTINNWILSFAILAALSLASCSSDDNSDTPIVDPVETNLEEPTATTALSLSNAPVTDGSDSTEPLIYWRNPQLERGWRQRRHHQSIRAQSKFWQSGKDGNDCYGRINND